MYEVERQELIDKLRAKGITDESVLDAIGKVERHLFIPDAMKHFAYNDIALPIGYGQTISQPYTVAIMTEALKLKKGSKILEIGTGSGYQAAILFEMGMKVYSIERHHQLYMKTQKLFEKLGIRAVLRCSDGTLGWEEFAPFDGIIVTAGSPDIPENLKRQLAVNGRLVIPVGKRSTQKMMILEKKAADKFTVEKISNFVFVPLIGKEGWKSK